MILHLDMDAFFASVEQLDHPELKGKCVIVGGRTNRGVVAAASYEARKFGIHSAMPIFQARKRCRDLVIVPPRRKRYSEISHQVMGILAGFTPLMEQVSIDEAFMDITGCEKLFGSPLETARRIKRKIKESVHLNCSVGVAPNKFLAKIASDMDKPDGLYMILPEAVPGFIDALPVGKVPGVGRKTRSVLERMGIRFLGDIKKIPRQTLVKRLGKYGYRLMELANGADASKVTPHSPVKSISSERTLSENTAEKPFLNRVLLEQAEEVGRQMRKKSVKARTVVLKLKYADFRQITRSETLAEPTQSSETLYTIARNLLNAERLNQSVRLIGVGASGLVPEGTPTQMGLFSENACSGGDWSKVDKALDAIAGKFGSGAVKRASLTPCTPEGKGASGGGER